MIARVVVTECAASSKNPVAHNQETRRPHAWPPVPDHGLDLAWTCFDCADTLRERDPEGARAKAISLLDESLVFLSRFSDIKTPNLLKLGLHFVAGGDGGRVEHGEDTFLGGWTPARELIHVAMLAAQ